MTPGVVLTKDNTLKVAKPGVWSGKWDSASFNNVIAYYDMSMELEKPPERPTKDFVEPGEEPVPHIGPGTPVIPNYSKGGTLHRPYQFP